MSIYKHVAAPNPIKTLFASVVVFALLAAPAQAENAPAEQQAQSTAQKLKEIAKELNALDRFFSESEKKRTRWLLDVQSRDLQIAKTNQNLRNTKTQVAQTKQQLKDIQQKNLILRDKRKAQAQLIGEHVAAAYRLSGQDFLKQLLNQESPDEFERMIKYHQYFSDSRLSMLESYQ